MPTTQVIESGLMTNPRWTNGCPAVPGKGYQESLKAWETQQIIILRKIKFDLDKCELVNGNQFAMDVWCVVSPQIVRANWQKTTFSKTGKVTYLGYSIWRAIYSKASMKVQQDRPKEIGQEAKKALEDLNKQSVVHSGIEEEFT